MSPPSARPITPTRSPRGSSRPAHQSHNVAVRMGPPMKQHPVFFSSAIATRRCGRPVVDWVNPTRVVRYSVIGAACYCLLHSALLNSTAASGASVLLACAFFVERMRFPRSIRLGKTADGVCLKWYGPAQIWSSQVSIADIRSVRLRDAALLPRHRYAVVDATTRAGERKVVCSELSLPHALAVFRSLCELGEVDESRLQVRLAKPYRGRRLTFDGRSRVARSTRFASVALALVTVAWLGGLGLGATAIPFNWKGIPAAMFFGAVAGGILASGWSFTWWVCMSAKREQVVEIDAEGVRSSSRGVLGRKCDVFLRWEDIVAAQIAAVDEGTHRQHLRELVIWLRTGHLTRIMCGADLGQISACHDAICGGPACHEP